MKRLFKRGVDFAGSPRQRIKGWLEDGLMRTLLKNSGWLVTGTGLATLLGILTLPLKTRALGPEIFGLLIVILAYVATVDRLSSFRSWVPLIKFGSDAMVKDRPLALLGHIKLSLVTDVVGALLGFLVALAGAAIFAHWQGWESDTVLMIAVASIPLLFNWVGAPTGVLRIYNRFRLFTVQETANALLNLVGTLLVWWFGWGIWGFLIVTTVVSVIGKLVLLGAAFNVLRKAGILSCWSEARITEWRPFLRFGGWSYVSNIMDIPVRQLDVIIISMTLSLEASGIYRIIKQVVQLLGLLTDPIYQAIYPQFSVMMAAGDFRKCLKYSAKIGAMITLGISPISITLALTSPWWLEAIFGPQFRAGWPALTLFLLLKVVTLPLLPIHPLFTAAGYVRQNVWILGVSNLIYLALLWRLTLVMGLMGPVLAWLGQVILVVAFKTHYLRKMNAVHSRGVKGSHGLEKAVS